MAGALSRHTQVYNNILLNANGTFSSISYALSNAYFSSVDREKKERKSNQEIDEYIPEKIYYTFHI